MSRKKKKKVPAIKLNSNHVKIDTRTPTHNATREVGQTFFFKVPIFFFFYSGFVFSFFFLQGLLSKNAKTERKKNDRKGPIQLRKIHFIQPVNCFCVLFFSIQKLYKLCQFLLLVYSL